MKIRLLPFNIILLVVLLVPLAGCKSTPDGKNKKQATIVRLHLQVDSGTENSEPVPIFREKPVLVNVDKSPFVTEAFVDKAAVVDWMDGFYIQIKFDWHGTLVLDNITSANRGRRIAVYVQYDKVTRWLAAPKITQRISDGTFAFTPDATRAETERIVNGLNNVAEKVKKSL